MLVDRDKELTGLKSELERYKAQVAREIANKTKIAQSLDESLAHVREMEEITQQWQLEVRGLIVAAGGERAARGERVNTRLLQPLQVREGQQQGEKMQSHLAREQSRARELQERLEEVCRSKDQEITQLSSQLVEARERLRSKGKDRYPFCLSFVSYYNYKHCPSTHSGDSTGGSGGTGIDSMRFHFLKQAVYHLLTDFHADEQLRAISSILEFSPQEKKAVYSKFAERRK